MVFYSLVMITWPSSTVTRPWRDWKYIRLSPRDSLPRTALLREWHSEHISLIPMFYGVLLFHPHSITLSIRGHCSYRGHCSHLYKVTWQSFSNSSSPWMTFGTHFSVHICIMYKVYQTFHFRLYTSPCIVPQPSIQTDNHVICSTWNHGSYRPSDISVKSITVNQSTLIVVLLVRDVKWRIGIMFEG